MEKPVTPSKLPSRKQIELDKIMYFIDFERYLYDPTDRNLEWLLQSYCATLFVGRESVAPSFIERLEKLLVGDQAIWKDVLCEAFVSGDFESAERLKNAPTSPYKDHAFVSVEFSSPEARLKLARLFGGETIDMRSSTCVFIFSP
ncbi:MAG: hypothetical protein AAB692_05890 [Patescibacteria group bacterium]